MLENNVPDNKRFVPPPLRNRSGNRRKSGDRFEKANYSPGFDGDKSQASVPRNSSNVDHGDSGSNQIQLEHPHTGLIALDGCSNNEAFQLLNERWAAAMQAYNDPTLDLSERPSMYSGASGSSWGHLKLPYQMDFIAEVRRAIHNAQASGRPTSSGNS
ncbi:hypothetical protein HPP92_004089 [Vanilla planifolia]|uniref:Uncharacterized protein n=1 Tax=Vanilla planifolia TaxID=51239 RepID=A0A835SHL8_VANPL|nr:hypothetical protein HPP92_004089 [Vanilla planifolia]